MKNKNFKILYSWGYLGIFRESKGLPASQPMKVSWKLFCSDDAKVGGFLMGSK